MLLYSLLLVASSVETSDTADADTVDPITEDQGCAYKDYPGTCTYDVGGLFTYTGIVEGEEVSFEDNPYTLSPVENEPTAGSSVACTLSYITDGTCASCL